MILPLAEVLTRQVPCPCTSSLTSGEPQSHTSVMARKFLPQHHPGPSLLCSGSTREGSPGHDHLRSCPAHRAACAWACLVWWCAERNTTRAAWGRTDFISRQETLSGQIMRKSSSRIISAINLGSVYLFTRWQKSTYGRAVWLTGLPLEFSGAAHTGTAGLPGYWGAVSGWYLAACAQWVSSSMVLLLKM